MQATGVVIVEINGMRLASKEGAKLNTGGMERTPITLQDGSVRFAEKPTHALVTATLVHGGDADVDALNNFKNGTCTFKTDTGKTYLISDAFTTKPVEISGGEGEMPIEIAGRAAVEI